LGGGPRGTIMGVKDRALGHIAAHPKAPKAAILSLGGWKEARHRGKPVSLTPAIGGVDGLAAGVDLYFADGPGAAWRRHALPAKACRAGVKALGLSLWAAREEIASPTTTAVRVPAGLRDDDILAASRSGFGVVLSAGRSETKGKLLRIGHMGPVAEPIYA